MWLAWEETGRRFSVPYIKMMGEDVSVLCTKELDIVVHRA